MRILHLEDDPDYGALVRDLLQREGVFAELELATNRADFEAALARDSFDVILADYLLPDYDGLKALAAARERCPQTPFLLVSGTIGEEAAIASLKGGARDYVLKLWPERLIPAIRRAVAEAEERVQRQRAEAELRDSERQYRLMFLANPNPMWILDPETLAFLEVNEAAVRHYGYTRDEFLAATLREIRADREAPDQTEYLRRLLAQAHPVQMGHAGVWRHRKKDGSLVDVEIKWSSIVFKGRAASLAMASDVTERKRIEHRDAALSKLGQSLSSATSPNAAARIIRAVADDLFAWDVFTLDLYSAEEDRIYPILNVDTDRTGQRYDIPADGESKIPSPMARRVVEQGAELILRQEPLTFTADVVPIGDTSRPSASLMLTPIRNRTKVIGVLSVQSYTLKAYDQQDLNTLQTLADHCGGALERIRAEQALRRSEMLFHSVWENSVDGMRLTDEHGVIVAVNEAYCRLVGRCREELEGRCFTTIGAEGQASERTLEEYERQFRQRTIERQSQQRLTLPDGKVVTLENTNSFVQLANRPALLLGLFRDVTDQKRLEEQLRQAQKMEAIGLLAGGVAHDFNNILTVIHGHGSLLLAGGSLAEPATRSAQQIVQAAERAAGLTRQLLAFSRRQVMQPRRLDMNEVVTNMAKMLGRILGEDVALQLHYSSEPALVQADAGMMEQVLLNLAVNSRDAMLRGGVLTIRISVRALEVAQLSKRGESHPGPFVCLAVTDTGCGIPAEILPRIFDPFFTTKSVGKGTGLGLATVYGIVQQHRGWIEVESKPGQGATFRVFLPGLPGKVEASEDAPAALAVRGGTETILVVEDEDPVRALVCDLLQAHGYRILQAESGAKALEVWKACRDKVDLLLTDLVMPDQVNGRELAERLWAERPELKVLFTSGYSAEVVGEGFVLRDGLNYLQKPYPPQKLALAVRDCLDAAK